MKPLYIIISISLCLMGCSKETKEKDIKYQYKEGATVMVMYKFMGVIIGRKDGKYLVSYGADCGMKEDLLDERVLVER
jgi:hypothetical protein